jgi:hypothetical protein
MSLRDEARAIRSKLQVSGTPPLQDPNVAGTVEVKNRPKVAQPTSGPQRLTSVVPFDTTVFSLGQKSPDKARINDVGITGRTKHHVHLHTTELPATLVSLGGPASSVPGFALVGGSAPNASQGYLVSTQGVAWQEAAGQHCITSSGGDVIIRAAKGADPPGHATPGRHAILQSDHGYAEVNALEVVSVSGGQKVAITASSGFTPETHGYNVSWAHEAHEDGFKLDQKTIAKCLDIIQSGYGIFTGIKKVVKKIKKGESGWATESAMDVVKILADVAKTAMSINRLATPHEPGQVKVTAASDASIAGGRSASMFGSQSASVTSTISASVLGGTAGMKGLTYASIWAGLDASVKAFRNVSIESEFAATKISSKSKTEIKAEDGWVGIQGNGSVQISSKTLGVGVYGEDSVWLGAGDAGYGVLLTANDLTLAKLTGGGKKFKDSSFDGKQSLALNSEGWTMAFQDSMVNLTSSMATLKGTAVTIDASSRDLTINGKKIRIG